MAGPSAPWYKTGDVIRSAFKEVSPVSDDMALPQPIAAHMAAQGEFAHSRRHVRRLAAEGGLEEGAIEILEHRFYTGFCCAFRKPARTQ